MSAESAHARLKKAVFAPVVLIDVREPFEYAREHAPGALSIPLGHLAESLDRLPRDPDTEVLLICQAGGRSAAAAELLIESGRHRVFSIHGGTDAWRDQRLPLESGGVGGMA
jgi:adenylyltransferase/sulfurtransferase